MSFDCVIFLEACDDKFLYLCIFNSLDGLLASFSMIFIILVALQVNESLIFHVKPSNLSLSEVSRVE